LRPALLVLLAWGCTSQGRPVPVRLDPGPPARATAVVDSRVAEARWTVRLRVEGDGPPALTLDGRPVRGCGRADDVVTCRFPGLRPGEHLLGSGDDLRVWARVGDWDWRDAVVYLVIPDRFADGDPTNNGGAEYDRAGVGHRHGGDLAGLRARIPWLSRLGVNALWLLPVVEQVPGPNHGAGFPHYGFHGFWPERLDRVDPHLGTEDDLRGLVADLEAAGIRTVLDTVVNHLGYGATRAADPDLVRSTETGTCPQEWDEVTGCLYGLPDLRTERPEVAAEVTAAAALWVERFGVHGLRLDAAKHVGLPLLAAISAAVRRHRPDALLLGEVWGADAATDAADRFLDGGGLTGLFDFGFADHVLAWVTGRERTEALARHLERRHRRPGLVWAHFLDTHDTPGFLWRAGHPTLQRLAATLQLTVLGVPVVTQGDAVGQLRPEWPDNRPDLPPPALWDGRTLAHYRTLIEQRRRHPALSRGEHRTLHAAGDVLVYLRWLLDAGGSVEDAALVAVNRGEEPAEVSFPLPGELTRSAPLSDVLGEGRLELGGEVRLVVPGRGARVLATVR